MGKIISLLLILGLSNSAAAQAWGDFRGDTNFAVLGMALNTFPNIDDVMGAHDYENRNMIFNPFDDRDHFADAYQAKWHHSPNTAALNSYDNASFFTESYLRALNASRVISPMNYNNANLLDTTTKIPYDHREFPRANPFSSYSSI